MINVGIYSADIYASAEEADLDGAVSHVPSSIGKTYTTMADVLMIMATCDECLGTQAHLTLVNRDTKPMQIISMAKLEEMHVNGDFD